MTSTLGAITAQQRNYYSLLLIKRMLPRIAMHGEGKKDTIPRHMGKTIEWRFLASLPRATTALTEGVKPSETAMTWTKVPATIEQFGAYVAISDILAAQGIDDVVHEATEALGENAGLTLHKKLIDVLALGSNTRLADGVAARVNIAAANILDAAEIRRARRILAGADVPPFEDGSYHALVHPFTMETLTSDATIMQVASYGAGGISKERGVDLLGGVVLKFGGFTFKESTDAPVFAGLGAGGINVYGSLFYGKDWFAELDLSVRPVGTANERTAKLSGVTVMGVDVDTPTKDDPLGQFGTWGWKAYYAAVILQTERGVRVEHAVAA